MEREIITIESVKPCIACERKIMRGEKAIAIRAGMQGAGMPREEEKREGRGFGWEMIRIGEDDNVGMRGVGEVVFCNQICLGRTVNRLMRTFN